MSTENSAVAVAAFLRNESAASKCFNGHGILCEFGIFFCLADDSSFHGFRGSTVIFFTNLVFRLLLLLTDSSNILLALNTLGCSVNVFSFQRYEDI